MEVETTQARHALVIDVGNTVAKVAVFEQTQLLAVYHTANTTLDGIASWASLHGCTAGIVSTVIDLSAEAEQALADLPFVPLRLVGNMPLPMQSRYAADRLGADRIAAVAAVPDAQCALTLIVDLGTCITYDWVQGDCHLGGNIAPGISMRLNAMHDYTARLPLVAPEGETLHIGTTTDEAMRAGVLQGVYHEIVGYATQHVAAQRVSRVLVTGGDSHYLEALDVLTAQGIGVVYDADLVLKGLNRILLYNEMS